jgi:hypothetical protein
MFSIREVRFIVNLTVDNIELIDLSNKLLYVLFIFIYWLLFCLLQ